MRRSRPGGPAAGRSRVVAVGLLSGAVAGLAAGMGARVAMRLVALAGGVAPAFSVPGTLTVLAAALGYGIAGGVLYVAVRGRLPGTGGRQGLAFGLLVLLVFGPVYFLADQVGEVPVAPVTGVLAFSLLFVLGGGILGAVAARLERRLPRGGSRATAAGYRVLGACGLLIATCGAPAIAWQVGLAVRKVVTLLEGP